MLWNYKNDINNAHFTYKNNFMRFIYIFISNFTLFQNLIYFKISKLSVKLTPDIFFLICQHIISFLFDLRKKLPLIYKLLINFILQTS